MSKLRSRMGRFADSWYPVILIMLLVGIILQQRWAAIHPKPLNPLPVVGDRLAPVHLESIEGRHIDITWGGGGQQTVLYVFRPSCAWCQKNTGAVRAMALGIIGKYRLVGVSITRAGMSEYLAGAQFPFPVYVTTSATTNISNAVTPHTILVSAVGVVRAVWRGAYLMETAQNIERAFSIRLPPVTVDSSGSQTNAKDR